MSVIIIYVIFIFSSILGFSCLDYYSTESEKDDYAEIFPLSKTIQFPIIESNWMISKKLVPLTGSATPSNPLLSSSWISRWFIKKVTPDQNKHMHIISYQPSELEILETTAKSIDDIIYQGDQNLCPDKTICTVLTDCRLLFDLMDKACLLPNRLKDLTCGYYKTELMVCCPNGGSESPFSPNYDSWVKIPMKNVTEINRLNENCGRPNLRGWRNGYSGIGSQPWVAKIAYKGEERGNLIYPCCGSIITNKVVLTGAHCAAAEPQGYFLHSVRVGDFDDRTDPDCTSSFCAYPAQDVGISHIVVHPGYDKKTFRHDIALLVLKVPIAYSVAVQPICLLQNPVIALVGRKGKLVGWGKLAGQNEVPPNEQQIDLPVLPLDLCSKIYNRVTTLSSNHLCVGGESKKDACSGFGGGPLVMLDHITKDRYYQVGMLSFGSDRCGSPGIPSVYTKIQPYYDWIRANIPIN